MIFKRKFIFLDFILYHKFPIYEKPLCRFVRDWQVLVDCRVATLLAMTYRKANCKAFCNDLYIFVPCKDV